MNKIVDLLIPHASMPTSPRMFGLPRKFKHTRYCCRHTWLCLEAISNKDMQGGKWKTFLAHYPQHCLRSNFCWDINHGPACCASLEIYYAYGNNRQLVGWLFLGRRLYANPSVINTSLSENLPCVPTSSTSLPKTQLCKEGINTFGVDD